MISPSFKSKRYIIGGLISALMVFGVTVPAIASSPKATNLIGNNWRVFNIMPATNSLWDINQAKSDGGTGVEFPFQPFLSTTTGSFAVYLQTNYNNDLTGKTISTNVSWTPGSYETRSGVIGDAYVRIEFQDVQQGPYTSNDYWFYTGTTGTGVVDLNGVGSSGTLLTASLTDRSQWTNLCGQSATDTGTYPGTNCVGGTDPAVSPYDGFTNAMKDVKVVGLAFGRAARYASGVAVVNSTSSTFDMSTFTITPSS